LQQQINWQWQLLLLADLLSCQQVRRIPLPQLFINTLIHAGFDSSATLKSTLQSVRTKLGISANIPVPVGVGFIGWILDNTEASDDPRIIPVLDELPTAVWFAFGNDLGKYIAQVHAYDAKRAHKTIIFVIVNSVAEALLAANEWNVDVLVVQGILYHLLMCLPPQTYERRY
jgi:hypothetical protein